MEEKVNSDKVSNFVADIVRRASIYNWSKEKLVRGLEIAKVSATVIAECWNSNVLDDYDKDWLVEKGLVGTAPIEVVCVSADSWEQNWDSVSGTATVDYELQVNYERGSLKLRGYHVVGVISIGDERKWRVMDGTEWSDGLPNVHSEWEIAMPAVASVKVPCWLSEDGKPLTMALDELRRQIKIAADTANHGDEPKFSDISRTDMELVSEYYILMDGRIEELGLLYGSKAAYSMWAVHDGHGVVVNKSWASAWGHQLTREVFETDEAAVADMRKHSDTKLAYETFEMARAALASLCISKYGQPEGFTCVIQEGMNDEPDVYLEEYRGLVEAGDEEPEQYHPSSHEFGVVYRVGWRPLLNRIARVFRVRDEPRTDREQLK
jgi:hypothetical protein